jgi:hypothetical protein
MAGNVVSADTAQTTIAVLIFINLSLLLKGSGK